MTDNKKARFEFDNDLYCFLNETSRKRREINKKAENVEGSLVIITNVFKLFTVSQIEHHELTLNGWVNTEYATPGTVGVLIDRFYFTPPEKIPFKFSRVLLKNSIFAVSMSDYWITNSEDLEDDVKQVLEFHNNYHDKK